MPTLTLYPRELKQYTGKEFTVKELEQELPWIGLDIEDIGDNWIKVEYNPNRPDYSSPVGIARSLMGRLNLEQGRPNYRTKPSSAYVEVDPSVAEVRPYIVMAIIKNVRLTEESVPYIMNMQEDLHWAVGRDRRKAAIGLHDLETVTPPYRYLGMEPDGYRFEPLQETRKMTLQEILDEHPKGQKYRGLVEEYPRYPLITDANGEVLSFPPIINGTLTQISESTKHFLLDITGPSKKAIYNAMNIITTAFADEGSIIETMEVRYPDHVEVVPDFSPLTLDLEVSYTNQILGLSLKADQIIQCLERCRLDGSIKNPNLVTVTLPPYRVDVLHPIGLVEEVAIGYGLDKLTPTVPITATVGESHPAVDLAYQIREIMIGFGYQDLITFNIANKATQAQKTFITESPVILSSPVSTEYNIVRSSMLPSIMNVLLINRHNDLPHRIFEIGDTVHLDSTRYTKARRQMTLAAATLHGRAGFSEIKSITEGLLRELRIDTKYLKYQRYDHKMFLEGRAAEVLFKKQVLGQFGEIHPQVLNEFTLEFPCAYLELNLEPLIPQTSKTIQ